VEAPLDKQWSTLGKHPEIWPASEENAEGVHHEQAWRHVEKDSLALSPLLWRPIGSFANGSLSDRMLKDGKKPLAEAW